MFELTIFTAACIINLIFLNLIFPVLKKNIVAIPNKRSSHYKTVPSAGGISFTLIGTILSLTLGFWQPILIIPLAINGLIDDLIVVKSGPKYLVQLFTSGLLMFFYPGFSPILEQTNSILSVLIIGFILISLTGFINLVNFMDGLDGLVGGCMGIIFITISFTSDLQLIPFSGCLLAFLFFNWYPSKLFMGDIGSTFLGGLLCLIMLDSKDFIELFSKLLLVSPFLLDAIICILRRLMAGEPIFLPHKLHLFQRLHQAGLRHDQISSCYIFATLIMSIFYYFKNLPLLIISLIIIIFFGALLEKFRAVNFRDR